MIVITNVIWCKYKLLESDSSLKRTFFEGNYNRGYDHLKVTAILQGRSLMNVAAYEGRFFPRLLCRGRFHKTLYYSNSFCIVIRVFITMSHFRPSMIIPDEGGAYSSDAPHGTPLLG